MKWLLHAAGVDAAHDRQVWTMRPGQCSWVTSDKDTYIYRCQLHVTEQMSSVLIMPCTTLIRMATAGGWRMWRIVGARKANSPSSCMMPVNTQYQRKHYFHQHIMTVLEGDEFDLSAHFVRAMELDSDAPETYVVTAANKRKALSMLATDSERATINERVVNAARPRANYLEPYNDSQLRTKAAAALEAIGLTDGYTLLKVTGNTMHATTHSGGRRCVDGRHHSSNRFIVRFLQSGRMEYCCYGRPCCDEHALEFGD